MSPTTAYPPRVRPRPTQEQLAVLDDDGNPWRPDEPDDDLEGLWRRATATVTAKFDALTGAMQERPFLAMGVGLGLGLLAGFIHTRVRAA
jgi:hypothetical protein